MKKILTIVGARPQFVKAAVVSRAFAKASGFEEKIIHTGQHFDKNMSDVFFEEMEIPKPAYNLEVNSLGHGAMTGRMLEKLEEVFEKEEPDMVLVYGDTNSTIAGALAARKMHIPVAHVEAGLRSFNMKMPEEVNRILTDRISDILYCPTETAIQNLKREGYDNIDTVIEKSGDVMYDAALFYKEKGEASDFVKSLPQNNFVLCTIHRAENTDDPERLAFIVNALNQLNQETKVVLPLHPRTKKKLAEVGLKLDFETIDPVGYLDMVQLLDRCKFVVTDSGGLQKEAFFFKKHCLTLREQTEWVELIENGVNTLINSGEEFTSHAKRLLNETNFPELELYGKGNAGEMIVNSLDKYFETH
ncbi:non-hydrolyzing UDP-N-acetylglucosamine 2-epimerase [Luteibaculum oceani]|uniref:UDP-N-acetylglucosamine 2-epimerase (Non-hydrolyzing) n=1 Tax=Luteibaculum oceani TaxID=1294296 RepID=A0A5C6UXF6_9FLAO|nr:UDP-N-acetylglucosamine 2-epimerase (non-hydrolyzing) [Luteibaculum oceani]TXC76921.1 UDP-N-acetylglucosamine 2-epimerase (non-hydrolyzing) [Luteibaculum oceani]